MSYRYKCEKRIWKKVVDEQLKHDVKNIVAPFYMGNNSNLVKIKDRYQWKLIFIRYKVVRRNKKLFWLYNAFARFCILRWDN